MECSQIDLYEFLTDSELQQYYNVIKNELKITNAAQFKYATDEDLKHIGLSRPEIRRLRKYYEKHFPHGYLSKIKRLLQAPATMVKRDDGNSMLSSHSSLNTAAANETSNAANGSTGGGASPSKVPINKHIIPADAISVNKQLGTGEFGIVQQGVWSNGTERIQVAIKCLCRERMQSNPMEFLKEAAIMHSIEHENIVRLYGVVLATDSLMLVTELAHLRSLLECLKDSGLRVSFLTVPTLCEFAMQICNGMSYLENKRLIHRDLAARNILVFSKNKVKISDFGLSRALGVGKDYYKTNFNVNLKLPIAWCAPECINYLRFTNASDVWAYGVCLWEMFSYGFQPWAALTGLQILEAIDAPNYQRLEQPDCCPQEYYTLMMKCWQDDPLKRPKFSEIYEMLPDMKPEQLKAVVNSLEVKSDHLSYRQADIITVLDRNTGTPFWKGVLNTGKTGFFNPSNTVAYLEGLPSSNRDSFCRSHERSSKRKLRTEMISKPQNDFKHTGHVGIDGASFGDIAFLGNSQSYNHVPRQIVTPYKPSEDIEQTPLLLPPTPTSPDSMQSGYFADGNHPSTSVNPSFVSSTENTPKQQSSFQFPHYNTSSSNNPFSEQSSEELHGIFALQNKNYGLERKCFTNTSANLLGEGEGAGDELNWRTVSRQQSSGDEPHEYHEISDDEMTADKLDLGPSLLDEINSMFGSMSAGNGGNTASSIYQPKTPDFDQINIKNEFAEITSKLANNKNNGHMSKKKSGTGTVKPISVKDEKILNQAIEIANEISARSMNDLVSDPPPATQSPKRKFSFRFPHLSKDGKTDNTHNHGSTNHTADNDVQAGASSPYSKKKNFSEELKSIPDLQASIGDGAKEAYNSLIERKSSLNVSMSMSPAANLLRNLDTNEFDLSSSKTLPRRSIQLRNENDFGLVANDTQAETLNMPVQQAPRPMTLPTRGAASRLRQQLHLCHNNNNNNHSNRSNVENGVHANNVDQLTGIDGACESPSYLINTGYKFPDKRQEEDNDANPIPLPSREGKKHIKTNAKRHVRKYPLIIPANGVQRTLNKVTENSGTPGEEFNQCIAIRGLNLQQNQININNNNNNYNNNNNIVNNNNSNKSKDLMKRHSDLLPKLQIPSKQRNSVTYENTANLEHKINDNVENYEIEHTYQNLSENNNNNESCTNTPDTASLQFESILEADFNKGHVLSSPDVTDGFYNFSIQKEQYNKSKVVDFNAKQISGLYVNEDELRNLDMEKSPKLTSAASTPAVQKPKSNAVVVVAPLLNNQLRVEEEEDIVIPPTTSNNDIKINEDPNVKNCVTLKVIESTEISSESEAQGAAATVKEPPMLHIPTNSMKLKKRVEGELADNALFKKVRESCDLSMTKTDASSPTTTTTTAATASSSSTSTSITTVKKSFENNNINSNNAISTRKKRNNLPSEMECFAASVARLTDSNSVSCEDLLEFSDKKPRGCERGVDSDEVRIMVKVLGKDSVPERCLTVLEFINWDVHKAIKVIKLQNILSTAELSLGQSVDALKKYDWDLHTTALQLRNLRN